MKFSDLEDGERRLERFKQELDIERVQRENARSRAWLDRMPYLIAAGIGWALFFIEISTRK
jgi:hypothetical protein